MSKKISPIGDPTLTDVFEDETPIEIRDKEQYDLIMQHTNFPKINSAMTANFVGKDDTHYLLNANLKDVIRVPVNRSEKKIFSTLSEGSDIDVLVTGISDDNNEYSIDGSVSQIYKEKAFNILRNINDDEYVSVNILELTPGGYRCEINMENCLVEAFLPQFLADVNKIRDEAKDNLVGNTYNVCIESYSRDKRTWIVSRRKYLKQLIPSHLNDLDKETNYTGHVTGTAPFGIFVQFNECLTGLIHSSNLNDEVLAEFEKGDIKEGDEITFKVKDKLNKNKIILTQKSTVSFWDTIEINQEVEAAIKDHKPFGTLVNLDNETLGLIYKNEQSDEVLSLEKGDSINVKIIKFDRDKRDIFLSVV